MRNINASAFDRFIVIPFKSEGRDYKGCDCYGQKYLIYRDLLGIELESYEGISAYSFKDVAKLIDLHKKSWKIVTPGCYRMFDCVLMKTQEGSGIVAHLGIMIGPNKLIHTEERTGARIVNINDPFISRRVIEVRRHHKLVGFYE